LEEYSFHEGPPPAGFTPDYEESLYNLQAFRLNHSADGWHSFYVVIHHQAKICAAVHFHVADGVARSPLRGPFGSVEYSDNLPPEILFDFIKFFEQRLQHQGISSLTIKNYSQAYNQDHAALLQTFLANLNYRVETAEINSSIDVTSSSIEEIFHRSQKRRLDRSREAGMVFKEIEHSQLMHVYSFIKDCRTKKKYELSMSYEELEKTAALFPERYLLFGVFDKQQLAAAAITIRVRKNILYDFYHDHAATYDSVSPVTLLVSGIYEFCYGNKISLFDLGTSAKGGLPNFSLLHFKTLLGAKPSLKLTFRKIISQ
jgi:hypothetical protein